MAYITNDGARLIDRARTEGKSIVFGSVRMNTVYKSDPTSLVQKSEEWYGENHGSVVGCLSHVSVDGVSEVCDSKLAVQCNDNSVSWKSIGIYAHLDGEEGEELFACDSIENGEYKDVTIVELPVTLDGVVADFGLSEGGSGGGGGGGSEVPANMMTTDTEQAGLSGTKTWSWENYYGAGSVEAPHEGDIRSSESFSIYSSEWSNLAPLFFNSDVSIYDVEKGDWTPNGNYRLLITSGKVFFNELSATWADILKISAKNNIIAGLGSVRDEKGALRFFGVPINPNSIIENYGLTYTLDSSGYLSGVYCNHSNNVATISVIVKDAGGNMVENGRVSGVSMDAGTPLTFQSPIQLADGYTITYQSIFSQL